jgi:hypothetical protein
VDKDPQLLCWHLAVPKDTRAITKEPSEPQGLFNLELSLAIRTLAAQDTNQTASPDQHVWRKAREVKARGGALKGC